MDEKEGNFPTDTSININQISKSENKVNISKQK